MNKTLRLSLLSLLMVFCGTAFAQTVIDFDNNYTTLFPTLKGTSSNNSHDGDFTASTTSTPVNGITVTVSAKASGTNENRIWSGSPRLRMYSGALTVKAPAGKNIKNIEFACASSNAKFVLSTETGNLAEKKWEGSANEIVFKCDGNTQIKSMTIFLDGEEVPNIANTPETAYTVAEANKLIAAGVGLDAEVYVKGIISEIKSVDTGQYGNAEYAISDDGTTASQLVVYRGYYLNKEKFTAADQIKVGDIVIVCGKLVNFNGTYEFTTGNYIHSFVEGTGINNPTINVLDENAPIYNLAGQRVSKDTKGILIQNGRKFINNK